DLFRRAVFDPAKAPCHRLQMTLYVRPSGFVELPDDARKLLSVLGKQDEAAVLRRHVVAAIEKAPAVDTPEFAPWFAEWRHDARQIFDRGTSVGSWRTHWFQANQGTYSSWKDAQEAFDAARQKIDAVDAIIYTVEAYTIRYKHAEVKQPAANHRAASA